MASTAIPTRKPHIPKRKPTTRLTQGAPLSHQTDLKQLICTLRNTNHHTTTPLTPSHLFTGVGSDEAIDLLLRCFCIPRESQLLICPPTYGMYSVAAQVNDTPVVSIPQLLNPFRLDLPAIHAALSAAPQRIRLMYLTSPGNPTGSLISKGAVLSLLQHPTWNGILVVDEAYIDFADPGSSLAQLVTQYPNLVVMQTLSKAFGLAGVRLGFAFAAPEVAALLNAVKAPYNVSSLASAVGRLALRPESVAVMGRHRASIVAQRDRLVQALARVPGLGPVRGGTASNFLLVPVLSGGEEAAMGSDGQGPRPCNEVALACYEALAGTKRVVVRFRGKEYGCEGCLRITVGTEEENDRLLAELPEVLKGICRASGKRDCTKE